MLWLVLIVVAVVYYLIFSRRKRADDGATGRTTSGASSDRTGDGQHHHNSSEGIKHQRPRDGGFMRSDGIESIETMQLRKRLMLERSCNCITIAIDTVSACDNLMIK